MGCAKKKFPKPEICTADLRHRVALQTRSLGASFTDNEPIETFATIDTIWAAIETPTGSGSRRFSGVALDDNTTHIFWVRYNTSLPFPEDGNHFFLYRDQRYRIIRVANDMEQNEFYVIQCSNRGIDTKAGASA
jgi:SPP1 family predicted phage head-tail adaptor